MVDETRKVIRVEVESQRAQAQLDALRKTLQDMGVDMGTVNRRLDGVEKSLNQIGKSAQGANDTAKATQAIGKSAGDASTSADKLAKSQTNIISQRYALYDVANAYLAIGAALVGAAGYAIVVGAQFEAAFTNVQRTLDTSVGVGEVNELRQSLVGLSQQIPLTFQEISQIATIGNQMGIASENVEGFTSTVARFASVSGMSIDAVTKAFGTFAAQTGLSEAQFENLGASIAKVSIDSNATEEQIVSLMREITRGARQAGIGADAIVGLSGTLASLGIAPERARGSLSTYFNTLNKAVADGGQDLQNFATIVGVTTEELSRMVQAGEGADVLRSFLGNLQDLNNVGVTKALDELGLAQLRVSDTFIGLSNSLRLYDRDQQNANAAFMEGAELQRQYAQTVDDLASQWQIFLNSLNALIDAVTGGAIPGLAALFQVVNKVVQGFTAWLGDNSLAASVLRFVAIFGALVGVLALVRAGAALARGTMLAFAIMNAQATATGVAAAGTFRGMAASLFGVGTAATGAARGLRIFRAALISTGIGAAAFGLGFLLENLIPVPAAMEDASISAIDYGNATQDLGEVSTGAGEGVGDLGKALDGTGASSVAAAEKIRTLVDYVNDLAGVFRRSSDIRFGEEAAMDTITDKWLELNEQAREYETTVRSLTADRNLKEYWLGIAEAYDDQLRAAELREEIAQIDDKLSDANKGADMSLGGNSREAIRNRATIRGLLGDYEDYILAMAGAGASQEEIQREIARLNKEFLTQGKGLGFSEEELKKYLLRFEDLEKIINAVPRDIDVDFNTDPALQALNEFFAKAQEIANQAGVDAGKSFGNGVGSGFGGGGGDNPFETAVQSALKGSRRGVGRAMKSWWDQVWENVDKGFGNSFNWNKFWGKPYGAALEGFKMGSNLAGGLLDGAGKVLGPSPGRTIGGGFGGGILEGMKNAMSPGRAIAIGALLDGAAEALGPVNGRVIGGGFGGGIRDGLAAALDKQGNIIAGALVSGAEKGGLNRTRGASVGGTFGGGLLAGVTNGLKGGKAVISRWVDGIGWVTYGQNSGTKVSGGLLSGLKTGLDKGKNPLPSWLSVLGTEGYSRGSAVGGKTAGAIISGANAALSKNVSPITNWARNLNSSAATAGRAAGGAMAGGLNAGLTASDPIFQWEKKQVSSAPTRGRSIGNTLGRYMGSATLGGLNAIDPIFQWEKKQVRDANSRGYSIGRAIGRAIGTSMAAELRNGPVGGIGNGVIRNAPQGASITSAMAPWQNARSAPPTYSAQAASQSGYGPTPVELGPASLEYLANALHVSLIVDGRQLATASSGGDKALAWAGSN